MPNVYDLLVIGGGLVGLSAAYHGARLGARTLLLDRHDAGRATDAGAGILSPETSIRNGEPWYEFAMQAVGYYPVLVEQMNEEGLAAAGIESGYSSCAKLLVAVSPDELPAYEEARETIMQRQARRRVPAAEQIRTIDGDEARTLFPALAEISAALYQPRAGRMNGRVLAVALNWAARNQGADVLNGSATELLVEGRRVTGVRTSAGGTFFGGATIIAGGAWSPFFGAQLDLQIPVEPQRGQIIHLEMNDMLTGEWPILNGFRGHYVVPWPDNRVAIGATRELNHGFDVRPTAGGLHEVLHEALRLAPGLAGGNLREIRVGLRPYTQDGLPVLGAIPGLEGIYLCTGHGPTGLQLGPFSGRLVAEEALGRPPAWDLSQFSVARFGDLAPDRAIRQP